MSIEAESAIRKLNARYCDAIIRRDPADWGSLWHEKAKWYLLGNWMEGRESIVAAWEGALSGLPVVYQRMSGEIIEVNGDRATCRVYVDEQVVDAEGKALNFVGVYNDECVYSDQKWLYMVRRFDLIATNPGKLDAESWMGYPIIE